MRFFDIRDAARGLAFECRRLPTQYVFRRPAILALAALVGALLVLRRMDRLMRPSDLDPVGFAGTAAAIVGVVSEAPDLRPSGGVYNVAAETIAVPGERAVAVDGSVLCEVLGSTIALAAPGDRVRFFGRLRVPEPARIPGTFDYRDYLAMRGTYVLVYAGPESFDNLGASGRGRLAAAAWRFQRRVVTAFERRMPPAEAAVLAGLTVGQRPRFFPDVRRAFIDSGTMHVLVASGSNVGFILAGWLFLSALAGFSRRAALVTALPAVWGYVLVVGNDAPIARGGAMATVAIAAYAFAREDRPVHALAVAALVRLALEPASLFDVSFQMSFVTVLGLMHHLPPAEPWLAARPVWLRWPLGLLFGSFVAHLWLMPVSAGVFHRVPISGLVANLVIVPLAELGLPVGLAVAALDHLPPGPATGLAVRAAGRAAALYSAALMHAAAGFASLGHPLWLPLPTFISVFSFYCVCLTLPFVARSWLARIATLVGLTLLVGRGCAPAPFAVHGWGAAWVDCGPRCATVLVDGHRHAVIVNPGPVAPVDSAERTLAPFLAVSRIRSVDAVVVTDPRVTKDDVEALLRQRAARTVVFATSTAGAIGAPFAAGGFRFTCLPSPPAAGETPILVERDGRTLLLGHRLELETQGALLDRGVAIGAVQARFAADAVWSPAFVRTLSPGLLVETAGASRASAPPWAARVIRPQVTGWCWWDAFPPGPQRKS